MRVDTYDYALLSITGHYIPCVCVHIYIYNFAQATSLTELHPV